MLENNGDIITLVKGVAEISRMNFVSIFVVVKFALEPYGEFFTGTKSCFEFFSIQPLGSPLDDLERSNITAAFQYGFG